MMEIFSERDTQTILFGEKVTIKVGDKLKVETFNPVDGKVDGIFHLNGNKLLDFGGCTELEFSLIAKELIVITSK